MDTYLERSTHIRQEFLSIAESHRLLHLMEKGKMQIDAQQKSKDVCMINNCQSRSWMEAEFIDGLLSISTGSDSMVTRGILSVFTELLSGLSAGEVLKSDLKLFSDIGLSHLLVSQRSGVFHHVIKKVHDLAREEIGNFSPINE